MAAPFGSCWPLERFRVCGHRRHSQQLLRAHFTRVCAGLLHMKYITHKRFHGKGISGLINIPFGTKVRCECGWLITEDGRIICRAASENGYEHFHPDIPEAHQRHKMISALEAYYKNGGDISELYYREFAPNENDYWLHILRTMDTPRLTTLCLKNLGKIPI